MITVEGLEPGPPGSSISGRADCSANTLAVYVCVCTNVFVCSFVCDESLSLSLDMCLGVFEDPNALVHVYERF